MGSDCDDVGALALLHTYADLEAAEILACVYSSGKIPYGVGVVQAINTYYGREEIPVGAYQQTDIGDSVDKMDAIRLANDTASYGNTLVLNRDAPELTKLLRRVLSNPEVNQVIYVTVGHTKGLYDLLTSEPDDYSKLNGKQLIKAKISKWVALGALNAGKQYGGKDWNFYFNGTAPYTKYLVENFPVPIYYISAGTEVMTGASLEQLAPGVIVRDAYVSWLKWYDNKTLADQRPSWDLAAVYYAVIGEGDFLRNTGRGSLHFDLDQGCVWNPGSMDGPEQYYVVQRTGVTQPFADYLNQMISRKPRSIDN